MNWLVITDAFPRHPCIYLMSPISTRTTKNVRVTHPTGAPYYSATNEAAETLVTSFKQALKMSSLSSKRAFREFLMQYRRTPTSCESILKELLTSRQIWSKIGSLLPSPVNIVQGKQSKRIWKAEMTADTGVVEVSKQYKAAGPVLSTTPWHATPTSTRSCHKVIGYSLLQCQCLSSWPSV